MGMIHYLLAITVDKLPSQRVAFSMYVAESELATVSLG